MADSSGLTPQERHNIINDKLAEYKKKVKTFHMRWTPGDLLDAKVLKSTPAFWYMRFGWSRQEIEGLFLAAKIYIDPVFDSSLDAVFGTDGKGPRWLPPDQQELQRSKWNKRDYYKTKPWWQVKQLGNVSTNGPSSRNYKDEPYAYDKEWRYKQKNGGAGGSSGQNGQGRDKNGNWTNSSEKNTRPGRSRSLLNNELTPNAEKIWQKASNYGNKNEKINYKQFKEGLNANNIEIDDDTAKKLFNIYADKDGFMNYSQFLELLKKLDDTEIKPGVDIGPISLSDLGPNLQTQILMKRVLLAASMDVPFNVTDFLSGSIKANIGSPGLLLGKLAARDADWNERMNIMENIANNLGTNPEYDEFLEPHHATDLLGGWAAQMLDTKQPVSKTAIDQLPTVFHEIADKSHPDVAMSQLDNVVDALFNVLDNKKHEPNHEAARKALKDIVDDVVHTQDAEAVLYLTGLLGEKTNIENCTDPEARAAALDNIKRVMMGDNADEMDPKKMPSKADDPNKEWLETGVGKKDGPSEKLMEQGKDNPNNIRSYYPNGIADEDLVDNENSGMRGKRGPQNQQSGAAGGGKSNTSRWGGDKENYGGGARGNQFGGNGDDDDVEDTEEATKRNGARSGSGDTPASEAGSDANNPNNSNGRDDDVALGFGTRRNKNGATASDKFPAKYDIAGSKKNDENDENDEETEFTDYEHSGLDGKAKNRFKSPQSHQSPPVPEKRKKGKDKELALKFSRYGNRDPPMHSNDPNDKKNDNNPKYGSQKPNNVTGAPDSSNAADDDLDDLDDSGNPNDPAKKGGKRGGTKRQGTNGKKDFDGKFGDDSKKQSPYGAGRNGTSNPQDGNGNGPNGQPGNNANGGGNRGNSNDPNANDNDSKEDPMSSKEIGDEFRNVVSDAVSNALMDPNKKNKDEGAKLADKLNEMAPGNYPNTLDGEAKKRYFNWKRGPMKPYIKQLPPKSKPLPGLKTGTAKVHTISGSSAVTIKPPTMPDI